MSVFWRRLGRSLSAQVDEALSREEYHRERLLYWRRYRRELERRVPGENPLITFIKTELRLDDDDKHTPITG